MDGFWRYPGTCNSSGRCSLHPWPSHILWPRAPVVRLRLRKVTYLTAAGNELTGEGLDGVRALKDLKVLNASGNRVRRIPPAVFSQFRHLQALVLNNNDISEVPPTWFKKGLLSLNTLVLSHNKVCA